MAIFHAPESGYPIHQPQVRSFVFTNLLPGTVLILLAYQLEIFSDNSKNILLILELNIIYLSTNWLKFLE